MNYYQFSPRNPTRPVNWRWLRAEAASEHGLRPSRRHDDAWARRSIELRIDLARANGDGDMAIVVARHDAAYWAYSLYNDRQEEDLQPTPYEIEARLLARQDYGEIGRRLSIDADIVEAYERMFFHVLEPSAPEKAKIDCPGYITHQAIGPRLQRNLSDRHYDVLWKLFGYVGGPFVLDAMIGHASDPVRPTGPGTVGGFMREMTLNAVKAKANQIAHTFRDNGFGAVEILNTFVKLVELERTGGASKSSEMLANVDELCKFIPFSVGSKTSTEFRGRAHVVAMDDGLDAYDDAGIELTGAELMAIGSGMSISPPLYEFPPIEDKVNVPEIILEHQSG